MNRKWGSSSIHSYTTRYSPFASVGKCPDSHGIGGWVRPRTGLDAVEKKRISSPIGNRLRYFGCRASSKHCCYYDCCHYNHKPSLSLSASSDLGQLYREVPYDTSRLLHQLAAIDQCFEESAIFSWIRKVYEGNINGCRREHGMKNEINWTPQGIVS
jgi:hypothetical protein